MKLATRLLTNKLAGGVTNPLTSPSTIPHNEGKAQQPHFHLNPQDDHEPLGSWFESTSGSQDQKLRLDGGEVEVGGGGREVSSRSSASIGSPGTNLLGHSPLNYHSFPPESLETPTLSGSMLEMDPTGSEADGLPLSEIIPRLSPEHQRIIEAIARDYAKLEGIALSGTPESKPKELSRYIPAWQNSLGNEGYSPGSMDLYRRNVERFFANVPPPYTTIAIEGYIASRREEDLDGWGRHLSPTAVKNDLKAIKSFFGFLLERDIIATNPTAKIKHPKIVKEEKVCPKPDEMAKFLAVLAVAQNPKAKLMLSLFINTGIRFDELATLTWGKVNLEQREISVLGKGRKWRTIPIELALRDFLAELRNSHDDSELLFPTESKKGKWDNSDANKMIARLCRRAGIRKYSCHQFRHYFATYTLKAGARIKVVQELLGHAQASTTYDFYDHTTEEEVRKAHETFAPLLGEVLKPKKGGKHGKAT